MRIRISFLFVLALTSAALTAQKPESLDDLAWLAGRWTGAAGETEMEEVWMAPGGGVMIGMHRDVFPGGRFFHEHLMIRQDANGIVYDASPRGGSTTPFRLTDGAWQHAVFTNPEHDFPQRIEYRLSGDELHVSVAGSGEPGQSWTWRRAGVPVEGAGGADTGYVVLEPAREIAMARSAGPATVSAHATVWVINAGQYRVAVEGTNGNHCFVARTWPRSMEPVCYDPEASRTILPIEIRTFELRRQGMHKEQIDRTLREEIGSGALPVPRRPAMSYMMSSAQVLFDDDGNAAGNWRPHLMLYMPYVTLEELGAMGGPTGEFMVVNPGEPTAYLMIVVPDFVDPVF